MPVFMISSVIPIMCAWRTPFFSAMLCIGCLNVAISPSIDPAAYMLTSLFSSAIFISSGNFNGHEGLSLFPKSSITKRVILSVMGFAASIIYSATSDVSLSVIMQSFSPSFILRQFFTTCIAPSCIVFIGMYFILDFICFVRIFMIFYG